MSTFIQVYLRFNRMNLNFPISEARPALIHERIMGSGLVGLLPKWLLTGNLCKTLPIGRQSILISLGF